jgi:ribosomal protein S27E
MKPPSTAELQKVAAYWQWVKAMGCEHPEMVFTHPGPPTCGECGHPLRILSDVQIEAMREK